MFVQSDSRLLFRDEELDIDGELKQCAKTFGEVLGVFCLYYTEAALLYQLYLGNFMIPLAKARTHRLKTWAPTSGFVGGVVGGAMRKLEQFALRGGIHLNTLPTEIRLALEGQNNIRVLEQNLLNKMTTTEGCLSAAHHL